MLRVLAARGEGQLALALLKDMRAVGQYLTPSAYSLMVQAFCKAGALQVSNALPVLLSPSGSVVYTTRALSLLTVLCQRHLAAVLQPLYKLSSSDLHAV